MIQDHHLLLHLFNKFPSFHTHICNPIIADSIHYPLETWKLVRAISAYAYVREPMCLGCVWCVYGRLAGYAFWDARLLEYRIKNLKELRYCIDCNLSFFFCNRKAFMNNFTSKIINAQFCFLIYYQWH